MEKQIQATIAHAIAEMKSNPFLTKLASGYHSTEVWQKFGAERCNIADQWFIPLLSFGRDQARDAGDNELGQILNSNILDELGLNEKGCVVAKPHPQIRKEFYQELGVTDKILSAAMDNKFPGALVYKQTVGRLIAIGANHLRTAGAILYIETTLSAELTLVLKAVTQGFANLSEQSLWYLTDHIHHDAQGHGPMLKKALAKYTLPADIRQIIQGVIDLKEAKQNFYRELSKEFLWE